MDVRFQIGQRLVGGFGGKEMSPEFIRLVKEYKISNVILFSHNIESSTQLKELCNSIQTLVKQETGHGAFITIDQEGGVVSRLPKDSFCIPGAMAVAAAGDARYAKNLAEMTGMELRNLGVNFNLAPIMDVNSNGENPVIGVRSYGDCPENVTKYACCALEGYQKAGILAAVKHFPGHGDTSVDSHVGLPVVYKSLEELEQLELIPFRKAIENGVPAVMSSHILFPKLEEEKVPCTMSRAIITGLLKEKMGFQGLVVSDCMEMGAIQDHYGTAVGVAGAMAAGVDLVFVSHSAHLLEEAAKKVYESVLCGNIDKKEMEESAVKILRIKSSLEQNSLMDSTSERMTWWKSYSKDIRHKSITMTQGKIFPLGDSPMFAGCADYRATLASSSVEGRNPFPVYMKEKFGGQGFVTEKNPDQEERKRIVEAGQRASSIIMCTSNAHLMKGQMELLQELSELNIPMTVVALRNPYDLSHLPSQVTGIAAWDYEEETMEILADILAGKEQCLGQMPVKLCGGNK